VPEEQLRDAYESRIDEFRLPERRDVTQVLAPDEAAAKAVEERLRAGATLKAAAQAVAGAELIPLGPMAKEDLPVAELAEAAFSLSVGRASPPVESPLGWHVLMVDKIEPPRQVAFAEARESLRGTLAAELAIDRVFELVNRLEDQLAGGATIEEAGRSQGLALGTVEAVDANGLAKDGKPVAALAGQAAVLSAAFATPEDEQSNLMETTDGDFVILRVDSVTAPALRPLGEVRAKVVEAWTRQRQREIARQRAEAALERAKGGESLSALAAAHGLRVEAVGPVTRSGVAENKVPPSLAGPLFAIKSGEATMAETAAGFVVARLTEVRPATPSAKPDDVTQLGATLRQALAGDIQVQFYTALRRELGVTVNRQVLDSLAP
jgi:peptidyl-prolyl cis-trans isomerase D